MIDSPTRLFRSRSIYPAYVPPKNDDGLQTMDHCKSLMIVYRPWSMVQKQKPPVHNGTGGRFPWYHPNCRRSDLFVRDVRYWMFVLRIPNFEYHSPFNGGIASRT